MKKLSVFLYSMGPGGAERVVSNLLKHLKQDYQVHLVLMSDVISYPIPNEVSVHFIEKSDPYESGVKKLFRLFFALPYLAIKYKKICQKLKIDTHFVLMNRPCYIAIMARLFGLKGRMVISERSCPSVIYGGSSFNKNDKKTTFLADLAGCANKFLVKFLYPKADLILANAEGNADDLIQNFNIKAEKVAVLENALSLDEISKLKNEPFNSDFKPFFINIGRLDSGKNQAMLIRAIASIDNARATLGILGKGPLENELKQLIDELGVNERVRLLGVDKNPFKHIKNAKVLLCASRFEGFSNVLIEALACEKTIISTDHKSGARELIGDDEYGILVPVDDENAMRKAMISVLYDEQKCAKYEAKAYIKASEFDSKRVAKKLIEFLR